MFNPDDVFEEGKIYMTPEEGQNEESSHGMGKYIQDRELSSFCPSSGWKMIDCYEYLCAEG